MEVTLPEKINAAVNYIRSATQVQPYIGIILGTGLGSFADEVETESVIEYTDIPYFPVSTVESHKGRLIFGTLEGKNVVVMQGRFHYYEGYSMQQVTFPVHVMKALGIKKLLISNVSGSVNAAIKSGDLVIINDHINLHSENPLRGKNYEELGPRFPDMFEPYSKEMIAKANEISTLNNLKAHNGVYAAVQGPNLETQAEYRYLRTIGGDIVGMSTVPEVIVANYCRLPVFAASVVTDEAFPEVPHKITLEEILAIAAAAEPKLAVLFRELVKGI